MPTVELSPEWGIEAAADLQSALAPHLEAADDVVLAVPEARRVHSASLQLLLAFVRDRNTADARRASRPAPIRCATPPICLALARLGLPARHRKTATEDSP